jgi:hypothetical protein
MEVSMAAGVRARVLSAQDFEVTCERFELPIGVDQMLQALLPGFHAFGARRQGFASPRDEGLGLLFRFAHAQFIERRLTQKPFAASLKWFTMLEIPVFLKNQFPGLAYSASDSTFPQIHWYQLVALRHHGRPAGCGCRGGLQRRGVS